MNDRINRACDDALAAIDRAVLIIDSDTGEITGWKHAGKTVEVVAERCEIHPAQRFDRDAAKAMLLDAFGLPSDYFASDPFRMCPVFDDDLDDATDAVITWFGGKGAA